MAVDPDCVQCLLFIVCEASESGSRKSRVSSRRSKSSKAMTSPAPKGYVLLPKAFVNKQPETLEVFKQNDFCILYNQNVSSLQLGEGDKLEIIEILLDGSPPTSSKPLSVFYNGTNSEVLRLLFSNISVGYANEYRTAKYDIRPAVDEHNLNIFRHLLTQKANICCRNDHQDSLLHMAAKRGPEALVRLMLDLGADVNVRRSDGATPLHLAAKNGLGSIVQLLLDHGANIQAQDMNGETPLHLAASPAVSAPVVKLLLQNGANIHIKSNVGQTALFFATWRDDLNLVKVLLSHGADVNSQANDGRTPIFNAIWNQEPKLLEVLVKFGAQVSVKDEGNESVLHKAFYRGPPVLQYLLESHFLDIELLKESRILKVSSGGLISLENGFFWDTGSFKRCAQFLTRHIVKIIALNLHDIVEKIDVLSLWDQWFPTPFGDYKIQCETEVARMKEQTVGDTKLSYYDVLTFNSFKVACLLRNNVVAESAASEELRGKFPMYGNFLIYQFKKGKVRKLISEEGIKICNFLFSHFKQLPYEIKERILRYLSFQDYWILKEACGRFKESP